MPPIYVSFYTPRYEQEARELMLTLDAFNLPQDVRQMPDAGSWVLNCSMKAGFILSMLREHQNSPIVWLDADARVRQRPVFFDGLTCDFAAHWRHDPDNYPERGELLSGTLYFSGSEASFDLCADWMAECWRHPDVWDQKCLDKVLKGLPGMSVVKLPPEYTLIHDTMSNLGPPVIEHMQASRRLR